MEKQTVVVRFGHLSRPMASDCGKTAVPLRACDRFFFPRNSSINVHKTIKSHQFFDPTVIEKITRKKRRADCMNAIHNLTDKVLSKLIDWSTNDAIFLSSWLILQVNCANTRLARHQSDGLLVRYLADIAKDIPAGWTQLQADANAGHRRTRIKLHFKYFYLIFFLIDVFCFFRQIFTLTAINSTC